MSLGVLLMMVGSGTALVIIAAYASSCAEMVSAVLLQSAGTCWEELDRGCPVYIQFHVFHLSSVTTMQAFRLALGRETCAESSGHRSVVVWSGGVVALKR